MQEAAVFFYKDGYNLEAYLAHRIAFLVAPTLNAYPMSILQVEKGNSS